MSALDLLLRLFLLCALSWSCWVLWQAMQDNAARGRARIHGTDDTTSWSPRIPKQRTRL